MFVLNSQHFVAAQPLLKEKLMQVGETSKSEMVERADPLTGRRIIQLTAANAVDHPLYYYVRTITADNRYLIFHRLQDGELQYHRLDLETGEIVCLTAAQSPGCMWRQWMFPEARGVREFLGVLNAVTNELVYLDGETFRAVHVETLQDRVVAEIPADRAVCGMNDISPDGTLMVYPHADRIWWQSHSEPTPLNSTAHDVMIDVMDLITGESRNLLCINGWITHTNFLDNRRIFFCHPPTEQGILMTDVEGGWYMHIRAATPDSRRTNHYHMTQRGVMYEANTYAEPIDRSKGVMGIFDPDANQRREYHLNARITHIGRDPAGLLWFGEQLHDEPCTGRMLGYCPSLEPNIENEFVPLTEPLMTCGDQRCQTAHTHPMLTPDRRHILFTCGDPATDTNHPCLLDVSDLVGVVSESCNIQD